MQVAKEGGDLRRFSTHPHQCSWGIALHARRMDVCIVSQEGERLVHRTMNAAPAPFLKAIAPDRDGLVVAVACLFTWDGLADLGAQEAMPFVLGHARSMKALHGGTAKTDTIDSQTIATLPRGRDASNSLGLAGREARDACRAETPHPPAAHTRSAGPMSTLPLRQITCPRAARTSRIQPSVKASPSGCPTPPCKRTSKSTGLCSPLLIRCSAPSNS